MTGLDERRVIRLTNVIDTTRAGRRPLVVMLEIGGKLIRFRPLGTRRWYTLSIAVGWQKALTDAARDAAAEKLARKKARAAK
jgi:hypothetical protein